MEDSDSFSYKHVYRVPTIRVSDSALAVFLNNVSVQRQPKPASDGGEESRELILQRKQPQLRKHVHIHSQKVIQAIAKESLPSSVLTLVRRSRSRRVQLQSSNGRTDVGRTQDRTLSQVSLQLLRRHVSLLGRYDFALLSRSSKVPQTNYARSVLRKSLSSCK